MNILRLLIVASSLGIAGYFYHSPISNEVIISSFSILLGVQATILGFLVSAGSLLYAVSNTRLARNLQRTGHFINLLEDLFLCSAGFFVSIAVGGAAIFVKNELLKILSSAFIGVTCIAYLLLLPFGYKMWLLLSSIKPESNDVE